VRVESPEGVHVVEHLRHTYGSLRQAAATEVTAISPVR
jgi:hypothetical protein